MKNISFAGSSIFIFVNYLWNILPLLFWFESDPFSRDWQNFPQQKLWVLVAAIKNILIGKNNMVFSKSWAYFGSKIKLSYKNALGSETRLLKKLSSLSFKKFHFCPLPQTFFTSYPKMNIAWRGRNPKDLAVI